jgi:large conductance mechanosensitive channel
MSNEKIIREKSKGFIESYKKFALKGNIMDLAIAVVIGGAFSRIVQSLVNDIIMPLLSLLIGDIHFKDLKVIFKAATGTEAEVALLYGNFIQAIVEFLIISFSIFMVFMFLNRLKKRAEKAATEEPVKEVKPSNEEIQIKLLEEIRDALKNR